jgi:hypothetical protein
MRAARELLTAHRRGGYLTSYLTRTSSALHCLSDQVPAPAPELNHYAVMAAFAPAVVARQHHLIDPHDAVDVLLVDPPMAPQLRAGSTVCVTLMRVIPETGTSIGELRKEPGFWFCRAG